MPNKDAPPSGRYSGWYKDTLNGVLEWYHNGTKVGQANGSTVTLSGSLSATTTVASTTTMTAGTGFTVTTGNAVVTAGDCRVTTGNFRAGAVAAFATTEPDAWIVFKSSTQPAGTITTSGGVGANDTTVQKIVAGGTVSNVET